MEKATIQKAAKFVHDGAVSIVERRGNIVGATVASGDNSYDVAYAWSGESMCTCAASRLPSCSHRLAVIFQLANEALTVSRRGDIEKTLQASPTCGCEFCTESRALDETSSGSEIETDRRAWVSVREWIETELRKEIGKYADKSNTKGGQ